MKIFFAALFFIITINISLGQIDTIPKVNGEYEYQDIVILDSTYKKDDLYRNAKLYFVDNYKSAKDVIQYDDKEQGKIIVKGFLNLKDYQDNFLTIIEYEWDVYYSTEITGKDGKYKYRIYNIHIKQTIKRDKEYPSTEDMSIDEAYRQTQKFGLKKVTRRLCDKMVYRFNSSIETLKTYMAKKQPLSKDDF